MSDKKLIKKLDAGMYQGNGTYMNYENGKLVSLSEGAEADDISYSYDEKGRLIKVRGSEERYGKQYHMTKKYKYDKHGNLKYKGLHVKYKNGRVKELLDKSGRKWCTINYKKIKVPKSSVSFVKSIQWAIIQNCICTYGDDGVHGDQLGDIFMGGSNSFYYEDTMYLYALTPYSDAFDLEDHSTEEQSYDYEEELY